MQLRLGDDPGALITDSGLERGAQAPDSSPPTRRPARPSGALFPPRRAETPRLRLAGLPLVPGADPRPERGPQDPQRPSSTSSSSAAVTSSPARGFGRMNRLERRWSSTRTARSRRTTWSRSHPFAYLLDHERPRRDSRRGQRLAPARVPARSGRDTPGRARLGRCRQRRKRRRHGRRRGRAHAWLD